MKAVHYNHLLNVLETMNKYRVTETETSIILTDVESGRKITMSESDIKKLFNHET